MRENHYFLSRISNLRRSRILTNLRSTASPLCPTVSWLCFYFFNVDTTQSTTSTNRERDQMIKSRTVDSGNRRSNIQDQLLLSKEAPAVLRTSPTKNSHHLKESRQKSPRSRPSSKNRHLQNCNLETPCVLRTEELPDKTLLSVNVSDEQPVSNKHIEPSLEPTNPDSLKRSNSNTKGTHFSSSSEKKPVSL